MKKLIIALLYLPLMLTAQDLRENAGRSLFSDYKANRIGDAITIIVVESSQATNQAQTEAGRSSDLGLNMSGSVDGEPTVPSVDFNMGVGNEFKGGGSTQSAGMVKAKIGALIDSVLTNGLVRVTGYRKISINGEEQIIKISGIVRTSDIKADNTVYSYNISAAEISIEGNGMIDDKQSPGWLTKLFHWLF